MRKKSHIVLSQYLIANVTRLELYSYKKSFYLGSILPDCVPAFLTRRHTIDKTLPIVLKEIKWILEEFDVKECGMNQVLSRRLGEITHYIADYFTYPHNTIFDGSLADHCIYEKKLKDELKQYTLMEHKISNPICSKDTTLEAIEQYIYEKHNEYIGTYQTIEQDLYYIVQTCYCVVDSILFLLEERSRNVKIDHLCEECFTCGP